MNAILGAVGHGPVHPCRLCGLDVTGMNGVLVHVSSGEPGSEHPFRHDADTDNNYQFRRAVDRYDRDGWAR